MDREPVAELLGSVHLVGIGGAGMSALARVLLARGATVSGSDIKESRGVAALRALGARIAVGHGAENVDGAGAVVVSSAIPGSNPEVLAAREHAIPILQRAQVLALLMRERRGIAVAGTHGKTTTTSMIAMVLRHAGLDPTFLIGGDLNEVGTNAYAGGGEWLVAEADESDGSLLWLAPEIAVINNVEADHLDYYRDEREIRETFVAFAHSIPEMEGAVVLGIDDPGIASLRERIARTTVTFGTDPSADWSGEVLERGPSGQRVRVRHRGEPVGELLLGVPGAHNVRNALAALATSSLVGVPFDVAAEELASFGGVQRRFQLRGNVGGVTVIDDYAHHPTEVRVTLEAAREQGWPRVVAVFQPHRYSRTQLLGRELGAALAGADLAVITDVYGAGEQPVPGVTGKSVVDGLLAARPRARVAYLPKRGEVADFVAGRVDPGDLVLTIGAGDITMLADEVLQALTERATRKDAR
ncbi:MAG: UDP-N-acetylmuramate--L-alanine ligase [Actinomycetota bacterium]